MSWCFKDESSDSAVLALDRLQAESAIVPASWPLEIANSLLTAERRGRISEEELTRLVRFVQQLPIVVDSTDGRLELGALVTLARSRSLSAYDASYVHLAVTKGLPVATVDNRLKAACEQLGVELLR